MPKYITDVDRWLSHECRMVKAGETFETEFPKGMRLSDTLRQVKAEKPVKVQEEKAESSDAQA